MLIQPHDPLFTDTIEELTGRKALAFLSQVHIEPRRNPSSPIAPERKTVARRSGRRTSIEAPTPPCLLNAGRRT